MIRNSGKRMTVAQLKERTDKRLDAVDRRFSEVGKRFDVIDARALKSADRIARIRATLR